MATRVVLICALVTSVVFLCCGDSYLVHEVVCSDLRHGMRHGSRKHQVSVRTRIFTKMLQEYFSSFFCRTTSVQDCPSAGPRPPSAGPPKMSFFFSSAVANFVHSSLSGGLVRGIVAAFRLCGVVLWNPGPPPPSHFFCVWVPRFRAPTLPGPPSGPPFIFLIFEHFFFY